MEENSAEESKQKQQRPRGRYLTRGACLYVKALRMFIVGKACVEGATCMLFFCLCADTLRCLGLFESGCSNLCSEPLKGRFLWNMKSVAYRNCLARYLRSTRTGEICVQRYGLWTAWVELTWNQQLASSLEQPVTQPTDKGHHLSLKPVQSPPTRTHKSLSLDLHDGKLLFPAQIDPTCCQSL